MKRFVFLCAIVFGHSTWGKPPTIGDFLTQMPEFANKKPSMDGGCDGDGYLPCAVQNFSYQIIGSLDDLNPQTSWEYIKQDGKELTITIQKLRKRVLKSEKNGDNEPWSVPDFIKNLTVYQLFAGLEMLGDPLEISSVQKIWINGHDDGPYNQSFSRFVLKEILLLPNPFYDPKMPLSISGQFVGNGPSNQSVFFERSMLLLILAYYMIVPFLLLGGSGV